MNKTQTPPTLADEYPDLPTRMRALADRGHIQSLDLREKADTLDAAIKGFYGDPQTINVVSFMGAWARARRLWCDCTGEKLI